MTTEMEATVQFYTEVLGFDLIFHHPGAYVSFRVGDDERTEIGFMAPPAGQPAPSPAGIFYGIEVKDVEAEHQRLKAQGAKVEDPPEDQPWGGRRLTLRDPNGILLMLFHPITPDEEHLSYVIQ